MGAALPLCGACRILLALVARLGLEPVFGLVSEGLQNEAAAGRVGEAEQPRWARCGDDRTGPDLPRCPERRATAAGAGRPVSGGARRPGRPPPRRPLAERDAAGAFRASEGRPSRRRRKAPPRDAALPVA